MKLCSRLFVLYCRSRPKDDRSRQFDPHFEEVRGGVEPWWMARWKARAVIELLFLSLTVEALQGKMCRMESQHSIGAPTCHDFPRFVIVSEKSRLEVGNR